MLRRDPQHGLTLLEVMVVLAIVGLLTGALAVGISRVSKSALRRDAAHLSAALRSAYDRAAATGAFHRVVLDLDARSWRVERCEGKVALRRAENLVEEQERRADEARQAAQAASSSSPDDMVRAELELAGRSLGGAGGEAGASCAPVRGTLGQVHTLSNRPEVRIAKVHVARYEEPATSGQLALTFFPLGYGERTVVELASGDDAYSIAVHPMSGRVRIHDGPWKRPEDFVTRDAEGKELAP